MFGQWGTDESTTWDYVSGMGLSLAVSGKAGLRNEITMFVSVRERGGKGWETVETSGRCFIRQGTVQESIAVVCLARGAWGAKRIGTGGRSPSQVRLGC